ncbi:hypothetical protein C8Q77DRAFT_833386 [Trametes polyzona]|nr:hypothetical protein C8Q77DRAFT_833386 [Trametes polyzona]
MAARPERPRRDEQRWWIAYPEHFRQVEATFPDLARCVSGLFYNFHMTQDVVDLSRAFPAPPFTTNTAEIHARIWLQCPAPHAGQGGLGRPVQKVAFGPTRDHLLALQMSAPGRELDELMKRYMSGVPRNAFVAEDRYALEVARFDMENIDWQRYRPDEALSPLFLSFRPLRKVTAILFKGCTFGIGGLRNLNAVFRIEEHGRPISRITSLSLRDCTFHLTDDTPRFLVQPQPCTEWIRLTELRLTSVEGYSGGSLSQHITVLQALAGFLYPNGCQLKILHYSPGSRDEIWTAALAIAVAQFVYLQHVVLWIHADINIDHDVPEAPIKANKQVLSLAIKYVPRPTDNLTHVRNLPEKVRRACENAASATVYGPFKPSPMTLYSAAEDDKPNA